MHALLLRQNYFPSWKWFSPDVMRNEKVKSQWVMVPLIVSFGCLFVVLIREVCEDYIKEVEKSIERCGRERSQKGRGAAEVEMSRERRGGERSQKERGEVEKSGVWRGRVRRQKERGARGVSRRVECGVVDIYQRQVEVLLNLGSGGGGAVFF